MSDTKEWTPEDRLGTGVPVRADPLRSRGIFCLRRFRLWIYVFWAMGMIGSARPSVAAQTSEGGGPFPARNYNPVQLLFLSLPPETATTLSRGSYQVRLEMAESNVLLIESTPRIDATLKFETFRAALHLGYGVTDRWEAGLEIPILYRDGGFLDPFIISVEKAIAELNPERLSFKADSFGGYVVRRDGQVIVSGENRQAGVGDVVVSGKLAAFQEGPGRPALAVRAAIKLPTGTLDRAFGSGNPDLGIGMAAQKTVGDRWVLYLDQSVVFPFNDFGSTGLTLRPIFSDALAAEFLWRPRLSVVGQLDHYTSPFHGTGSRILDNRVTEGVLGFNYRNGTRRLWQLYMIENLDNPDGAAADFTLATTVAFRF